jgi:hypothetical protein
MTFLQNAVVLALALLSSNGALAFQSPVVSTPTSSQSQSTALYSMDRRNFGQAVVGVASAAAAGLFGDEQPANAQVFFDPAMYGDQELRVGTVDSLRESVRRAILKNPKLAPSFYQLALLDGLSFDAKTNAYGPDGSVMKIVLSSKDTDEYTQNLQEAAFALVAAEKALKMKTAVTIADAVAIGGAEAIESIGGPVLTVQLGRADAGRTSELSTLPIDLFSGKRPASEVAAAFKRAGLTEREMTALLAGLLTLETVQKKRTTEDWKEQARPKFREQGKMGRMSEFKQLTDEDIADAALQAELESDPEYQDHDDGWYIADSFGTRESRFGDRIGKDDISEKNFNKYLKPLADNLKKSKDAPIVNIGEEFGWIALLLTDPDSPTSQTWLNKYASSNLSYLKDLNVAFNSITQLGAVYTGGKYESLLNKKGPRKSLNDDDLKLF